MKRPKNLPIIRTAAKVHDEPTRVVIVKQGTGELAPLVHEYANEIADPRVVLVSVRETLNERVRNWAKRFFSRGVP